MNIYLQAFSDLLEWIKNDDEIIGQLEIIALLGSVRDNEQVINYSDLDVLLIVKTNKEGAISNSLISKLKAVCDLVTRKYGQKISLLPHTYNDFVNYVDIEYLRHYSWGNVVYGDSAKFRRKVLNIVKQKVGRSKYQLKKLVLYNLRHARFNVTRQYISLSRYNTDNYQRVIARIVIDKVFEASDWVLIYHGIWSKNKKEIVSKMGSVLNDKISTKTLEEAYRIRQQWNSVRSKELENFVGGAVDYLNKIVELTIRESMI